MHGPVPVPTPETAPFWDAARRGELHIQYCERCAEYYFYPRSNCPRCDGRDVEWRRVSGRARLVSYIINQRPLPPFDPARPIIVALVRLDEGPILMSNVVGVAPQPESLALGALLQVSFEERGDIMLPVFAPTSEVAQ